MEFRLRLRVTVAPGAPDPPDGESDGVCPSACFVIAVITHRKRTVLQYRALIIRSGFAI